MSFLPGNAQHIGLRAEQQDAFGFSDSKNKAWTAHAGLLAVIADGMGGMNHGQAASQIAIRAFLQAYGLKTPSESVPDALLRALFVANGEVVAKARSKNVLSEMGTTLVAVVLKPEGYHVISVGDSMAYLLRSGTLHRLNALHVHSVELDRRVCAGDLQPEEAAKDPDRHALTSFLGLDPLTRFDATVDSNRPVPARPGDRILLCSDGLSNALTESQIAASASLAPQQAAEKLVQQALKRRVPRQDNITVLVIARGDAPQIAPEFRAAKHGRYHETF